MGTIVLVIIFCLQFRTIAACGNDLKVGYYHQKCPKAKGIITKTVAKAVKENPSLAAALIRLHFHDCFVRGCDGSILLNSTADNLSEKDSHTVTLNPKGYEIVDVIKSKLEGKCAGVVSCADIIAYAARDSAYLAGRLFWAVQGGQRDGRISLASELPLKLPSHSYDVRKLTRVFASNNLSQKDMVALSGAHSIGVSHCSGFSGDHLYNFSGKAVQDPFINPKYAHHLRAKCPPSASPDVVVPFDPVTPNKLDVRYYINLKHKLGLLKSDQELISDHATSRLVKIYAKYPTIWRKNFGRAMVKMGSNDVLTRSHGEIRKHCRFPN